jgi:hypothetical protein
VRIGNRRGGVSGRRPCAAEIAVGRAKQETALCRTEFAVVASLKTGDGLVPHGIRRVASLKQETALCRTEIRWRLETGTAR